MESKKMDRRVRKTRMQLRAGLTQLMRQKPIKDITVRELAQLVDINRCTFYLHYRDIYDMVEQVEQEVFSEFEALVSAHPPKEIQKFINACKEDGQRPGDLEAHDPHRRRLIEAKIELLFFCVKCAIWLFKIPLHPLYWKQGYDCSQSIWR